MTLDQLKHGLLKENNDCVKRLVNFIINYMAEPSHTAATRRSVTVVPPPIESDLGYRFRRRTLNPNPDPDPNPDPNPNPNPNPRTHPNPNLFLTVTGTKFLKENKSEKNDTEIYVNIELYFHAFFQGRGWG